MEKTDFQDDLEGCSEGLAKIGCGVIVIPLLIIIIFIFLGLLFG